MKIELSSGVTVDLSNTIADDMELLELIGEMETGTENITVIGAITKKVFGSEKKKVYDSIRRKDGTVPIEDTIELVKETFNKIAEGKNFSS